MGELSAMGVHMTVGPLAAKQEVESELKELEV
jgi:hypothetical protein